MLIYHSLFINALALRKLAPLTDEIEDDEGDDEEQAASGPIYHDKLPVWRSKAAIHVYPWRATVLFYRGYRWSRGVRGEYAVAVIGIGWKNIIAAIELPARKVNLGRCGWCMRTCHCKSHVNHCHMCDDPVNKDNNWTRNYLYLLHTEHLINAKMAW